MTHVLPTKFRHPDLKAHNSIQGSVSVSTSPQRLESLWKWFIIDLKLSSRKPLLMSLTASGQKPSASISPLLKKLVGKVTNDVQNEVSAARVLLSEDGLSNAQTSLLLGLLKARGWHLNAHESMLLHSLLEGAGDLKGDTDYVSITSVLQRLLENRKIDASEIADVVALIFDDQLSVAHCSLLLGLLAYSGQDRDPLVLAKTAEKMRLAASQVDREALRIATGKTSKVSGQYQGGLCDIVGTGGDGHSTFNVSTTTSIVASSLLLLSKHGNRASSSTSGSADLLQAIRPRGPDIEAITARTLPLAYEQSPYCFLFAPRFHPGMKFVAAIRKELGIRSIFNVLGPLANPVEGCIEARIVGVAEQSMGPIFAEALRLSGAKKAMVVCGAENLDEISCAGKTLCWRLFEDEKRDIKVEQFDLEPADFGLPRHALSEVAGGKLPQENAEILMSLLDNKLSKDNPILDFVLLNTAALFAVSGVCEGDLNSSDVKINEKIVKDRGPGGQRWKEGVRRAREAIEGGEALKSLRRYIEATHSFKIG